MRLTESVHALKIPFRVTTPSGATVERFVNMFLIVGKQICLIDSGVAGSDRAVLDYVRSIDREPSEISRLVLTHSHPDHIGAARAVKRATGCAVLAHPAEKSWIEDVARQSRERPVPGFDTLVDGSVTVDRLLEDGARLDIDESLVLEAIHTPGHSRGSISLRLYPDGALFTGDAIPLPGDIPIYEDVESLVRSIRRLMALDGIRWLLASWDDPRKDEEIPLRFRASLDYLRRIHETVAGAADSAVAPMDMCRAVLEELGLPTAIANPLLAASFISHLKASERGRGLLWRLNPAGKRRRPRPARRRIVESARRKVADALVNGKALKIEGGAIAMMTVTRKFRCSDCGHAWEIPHGTGRPEGCPSCKSTNIHRDAQEQGFGRRCRGGRGRGLGRPVP